MLKMSAMIAIVAAVVGAALGAISMARIDGRRIEALRVDLADARRVGLAERAARDAIQQQCAAGDAAATLGADLNDTARRAIERANQELDNATGDDSDPLRAQFERLRGQGGPGAGGDPAAPAGGADAVPRRP